MGAEVHSHRIDAHGAEEWVGDGALVFPYWSFTKTAIAICALLLAERGEVDLDTRVPGEAYTLRQLLNHTAGLPDYGALTQYHRAIAADVEPWSRATMMQRAMAGGPLFAPGEGWAYSNIGMMLAREHIETASGQGFDTLVGTLITRPLGLDSVVLAQTRADFARVHWTGARHYHPGWVFHGCLMGSARDAALLLDALMSGELMGPAALASMLERQPVGGAIPGRPWTDCGYGLGLMTGRMGTIGRAIGHSGGGPFCVNAVYHFPDQEPPVTVASFSAGHDEGVPEFAAAAHARTADALPSS